MKNLLLSLLDAADRGADALKARIGDEDAPIIVPFRGHATATHAYLKGRVIEHPRLTSAEPTDSLAENALNMARRFESDEIPGARVHVALGEAEMEVVTDDEGYFRADLALPVPLPPDRHIHHARVALRGTPRTPDARAEAVCEILAVPESAAFGVISDVDDTVLQTNAANFWRMVRTTVAGNARTRLPFEGVAALYRALAFGTGSTADNPVFYVSSSPWNLYDVLIDFLDAQGLPRGPLFLRDLGVDRTKFIKSGHADHKLHAIRTLLACHPHLPFILIGDSGQHDPEIYAYAAREHPGRIRAVYIRDVTGEPRDVSVRAIVADLADEGVEMVFVADSVGAARHAIARGFVAAERLPDVRAEAEKDAAPSAETETSNVAAPDGSGGEGGAGRSGSANAGGTERAPAA